MAEFLRTVVVIDYQNLHLTGHDFFRGGRAPRHTSLLDPLLFADELVAARNRAQLPGYPEAALGAVLVFRGHPSQEQDPANYARNLAHQAHWERDARVAVTLRPLKYEFERDGRGAIRRDASGRKLVRSKHEKGVDVLCALAMVREARRDEVDLVILASADSDLIPALDEAIELGAAKVETCCWFDPHEPWRSRQLRPERVKAVWNTRLGEEEFLRSRDLTDYSSFG
jgi:uncharacterized LabA/DUF88 family protein